MSIPIPFESLKGPKKKTAAKSVRFGTVGVRYTKVLPYIHTCIYLHALPDVPRVRVPGDCFKVHVRDDTDCNPNTTITGYATCAELS